MKNFFTIVFNGKNPVKLVLKCYELTSGLTGSDGYFLCFYRYFDLVFGFSDGVDGSLFFLYFML